MLVIFALRIVSRALRVVLDLSHKDNWVTQKYLQNIPIGKLSFEFGTTLCFLDCIQNHLSYTAKRERGCRGQFWRWILPKESPEFFFFRRLDLFLKLNDDRIESSYVYQAVVLYIEWDFLFWLLFFGPDLVLILINLAVLEVLKSCFV